MISLEQMRGKILLFLFAAILILCLAFLFISCGDPSQKVAESEGGQFAVDFSLCPAGKVCQGFTETDYINPVPSVSGKEFTVEAWVKRRTNPSDLNGGIFGHFDAAGLTLYVKENKPKLAVRRLVATGTAATSTVDHIVDSGFSLVKNIWTHVAGALVNSEHNHPSSTSCTATVMKERPHLDIYVNGKFKECETTFGAAGDTKKSPQFTHDPGGLNKMVIASISSGQIPAPLDTDITPSTPLDAAIDEVRYWHVARTQDEIQECMNQELGTSGNCNRLDANLIGYWRMNAGEGFNIIDVSGNGFSASLVEVFEDVDWENGWVDGVPSLTRAD